MADSARARSTAIRAISPSSRFCASSLSSSSSALSALRRSASPARLNICSSSARSVRFSRDRAISSGSALSMPDRLGKKPISSSPSRQRKTCMCSPTTHPGSFRCSLHKGLSSSPNAAYSPSNRLHARRSAMTNSLVRIGTVEGDLVKRALAALIRPSSHQQRRRTAFQPRPTRLSVMSKAEG